MLFDRVGVTSDAVYLKGSTSASIVHLEVDVVGNDYVDQSLVELGGGA